MRDPQGLAVPSYFRHPDAANPIISSVVRDGARSDVRDEANTADQSRLAALEARLQEAERARAQETADLLAKLQAAEARAQAAGQAEAARRAEAARAAVQAEEMRRAEAARQAEAARIAAMRGPGWRRINYPIAIRQRAVGTSPQLGMLAPGDMLKTDRRDGTKNWVLGTVSTGKARGVRGWVPVKRTETTR